VLQCGAVWCSVVQCGAVWCSVLQCGAVWCSVLQCGAVWCSVLQCVTWFVHVWVIRYSYVWHDPFIRVTRHIYMCDMTHHTCDMTYSYVWHHSFICVTWLIHMSIIWIVSFISSRRLYLYRSFSKNEPYN